MKTLWNKISIFFSSHPLFCSVSIAFFLRTISSISNYGPAAIDDYNNIIGPALRLIQTGEPPVLPALRFDSLPYLFYYFMLPFHWLGIKNTGYLVSGGYLILSFISLLQVFEMYRLGSIYLNDQWRNLFTLLGGVHFVFSFFMTKAYLSSFAITSII